MEIHEERMWSGMTKWHCAGLMGAAVVHDFTEPDHGPAHDHPWSFRSIVLFGGYVEEVFHLDGTITRNHRKPGDSFHIAAGHIHRIIELPEGRCNTIIIPGEPERKSGFYEFRPDGTYHRFHDETEWRKI